MQSQPATGSDAPAPSPERRYDVDWLRLMAVFLLFFFHTARIFDPYEDFYARNSSLSKAIADIFIRSLNPWHMSFFFLLAGASSCYALRRRSGGQYVKERFKRLFVPFVFGVLVLIPPQSYVGLLSHSGASKSYAAWYPQFFNLNFDDMGGYRLGGHTWGHLWFICHLFVYSLIAFPFFLHLNRESGRRLTRKLAAAFAHPAVLFLFPIPLTLMRMSPEVAGGNPLFYITFFVCGYILMCDGGFGETMDRRRIALLVAGPILFAVLVALQVAALLPADPPRWIDMIYTVYVGGFVPWFVILALLAYGKRLLNFTNRFLSYFAEASYPIYILHQTVIVILGYFVVRSGLPLLAKYAVIVAGSFALCVLVYDLLVRRNNVTRFLFGMKPRARRNAAG